MALLIAAVHLGDGIIDSLENQWKKTGLYRKKSDLTTSISTPHLYINYKIIPDPSPPLFLNGHWRENWVVEE